MKRAAILAAAAGLGWWSCAAYAETINCTAINSLPVTISVSGIYCLKKDLGTSMTSGAAITINTNNVTIDMNGFRLGGLAGGPSSSAYGIVAQNRSNIEIRNGAVRGFWTAIQFSASVSGGAGGHLVRDMLIDGSIGNGVAFYGVRNSALRNSRIFDIGLPDSTVQGVGVDVRNGAMDTSIENNTISNVRSGAHAIGIAIVSSHRTRVVGNAVHHLSGPGPAGTASATTGVQMLSAVGALVRNNDFMNADKGAAVAATSSTKTFCADNTISGYTLGYLNCTTP